jgi:tetratricopeptide (TPR) repeat protein
MALDREKTFASAERLLKQGKVKEALDECRRLAEDAPRDLLMLNRVGDLLARSGRGGEAIVYYEKIAEQFSASGFYPKAIAILKKVVKVDPGRLEALVHLGELNLKQKLPGEARAWLLQAADAYVRGRQFAKAREVYEKLAAAEPDNFVNGVRLAEARAAEGDGERAGRELLALGGRMLAAGRIEDADRTLRRAAELLPGRAEGFLGLARAHAAAGRRDEALRFADQAWATGSGAEPVAGDLLLLFEHLSAEPRAAALLADPRSDAIADDAVEEAFRGAVTRGAAEAMWSRLMPLVDRWGRDKKFDRAVRLLERLARLEDGGSLRTLEQIVELRKAEGIKPQAARAIERLARAYQAQGQAARAEALLPTLKLFDPTSPMLLVGRTAAAAPPAAEPAPAKPAPVPAAPAGADGVIPVAFEAPAVPLTPADEEFVGGHLTEAEVFEKYGLHNEALAQLREVTQRFPGHVVAQDKLVGFLRTQGDRGALRDGLVALALARRAAGDAEGARRASGEASSLGGIESGVRKALEQLGLLVATSPSAAPPAAPRVAAPAPPPPPPSPAPARSAAPKPRESPPPAPVSRQEEEELEILFDDADDVVVPAAAEAGSEVLEEIEFYISQGMGQDALARIAELRASGRGGGDLDGLEARARGGVAGPGRDDAVVEDKLDEEDLSSIAAALEAEYGAGHAAATPTPAEPEAEQSVDEVFAAFKEHVRSEVEGEDFRTHYDLGIAYKEMGLLDDAVGEFELAARAPEIYREACSMLGLTHQQRGDPAEAIRWYRAALAAPAEADAPLSGLRYDLAEILLATGDATGAYELYAQVLAVEPTYRDVRDRVADLKSRLRL